MGGEAKSISPGRAVKKPGQGIKKTLDENALFEKFFETLSIRAERQGLTYGELAKSCGAAWRRGLAEKQKLKNRKPRRQMFRLLFMIVGRPGKCLWNHRQRG